MMMVWKIAPALAAGNTRRAQAVATPRPPRRRCSPSWPRSSCRPGVFNVVCGDRDTGRALVEHPIPQMVSITGSVRAGMEVAELGGRRSSSGRTSSSAARRRSSSSTTPTSRPPPRASPTAGYFNAGQDCTAATRVLAGPGVHADFVAALTEQAAEHQDRRCPTRTCSTAPLNNQNQLDRVTGMVDRLPDHASVDTGGHRQGDRGYFYEPTVVSGLQQDDEVIQDEIFGPVITVQKFSDEERGAALGQRREVRPRLVGVDQGPRPRDADGQAASTSAACGSTPTSRSSPRCRTAASSTRGYGKDLSMYGLEDYTRIKHVMSYIGE